MSHDEIEREEDTAEDAARWHAETAQVVTERDKVTVWWVASRLQNNIARDVLGKEGPDGVTQKSRWAYKWDRNCLLTRTFHAAGPIA